MDSVSGFILIQRKCGGWLATTKANHRYRIGVTGESEETARNKISLAVKRWDSVRGEINETQQ